MEDIAVQAPAPAPPAPPAQVVEYTPPAPPATQSSGDVFESVSSQKLDMKSILLFGLLIASSFYSIIYFRKAIARLEEDKRKADEFLNMSDDVEELKYNVKNALGRKYKATT